MSAQSTTELKLETLLDQADEWMRLPFEVWLRNFPIITSDPDFETLYDEFIDCYYGEHENATEYAEYYVDETGLLDSIPENLRYYFDYEKYGRDMEFGGDVICLDGYVFRNC